MSSYLLLSHAKSLIPMIVHMRRVVLYPKCVSAHHLTTGTAAQVRTTVKIASYQEAVSEYGQKLWKGAFPLC